MEVVADLVDGFGLGFCEGAVSVEGVFEGESARVPGIERDSKNTPSSKKKRTLSPDSRK